MTQPESRQALRTRAGLVSALTALVLCMSSSVHAGEAIGGFARNVALHVLLHELGHAVFHEFDVPILANEEVMADSFATTFIIRHVRDRAVEIRSPLSHASGPYHAAHSSYQRSVAHRTHRPLTCAGPKGTRMTRQHGWSD